MCKRALFVYDWQNITLSHLACIQQQALLYNELVFVIDHAEQLAGGLRCGQQMELIRDLLRQYIQVPFYLLPVTGKGVQPLHYWLRWRILCPAFDAVFSDEVGTVAAMQSVLGVPVNAQAFSGTPVSFGLQRNCTRGLFITRAQPFHNGHLAYIQQMSREVDEVVVVIAMANRSHQPEDFATGGERLAMLLPVLEQEIAGRYYLVALPYSDFSMENMYELEWLLPQFQYVYTVNPGVAVLAHSAGYETRALEARIPVSGTLIRECIVAREPYQHMMPDSVHTFLRQQGLDTRLLLLHEQENREQTNSIWKTKKS